MFFLTFTKIVILHFWVFGTNNANNQEDLNQLRGPSQRDLFVRKDNIEEDLEKLLSSLWKKASIQKLTLGLKGRAASNTVYRFEFCLNSKDKKAVIRVNGKNMDALVCRKKEAMLITQLKKVGFACEVYCLFHNGLLLEHLEGQPKGLEDLFKEGTSCGKIIARELASFHQKTKEINEEETFISKIKEVLGKIDTKYLQKNNSTNSTNTEINVQEELRFLWGEIPFIENALHEAPFSDEVSFCHNDLHPWNMLWKNDKNVHFIDFEFSSKNYILSEIAYHFYAMADFNNYLIHLSKDYVKDFLFEYFQDEDKVQRVENILPLYSLVGDLFYMGYNLFLFEEQNEHYNHLVRYNQLKEEFLSKKQDL